MCMGVVVFIVVVALVLWIAQKGGYLAMPQAPPPIVDTQVPTRPQARPRYATARPAKLSVKERAQLGLPIEYIGDSGQEEILDSSDPRYAVVAEYLLVLQKKR